MEENSLTIVTGRQVHQALEGKERQVIETVAEAYRVHQRGDTTLPHSSFLDFPGMEAERIIALPSYLGGGFRTAGLKWVSSFPRNIERGLERASALLMLNELDTGRVYAVVESASINGIRTAASAALAADRLLQKADTNTVGIVGCGYISFQILRFLKVVRPGLRRAVLLDLDPTRVAEFKRLSMERLGVEDCQAASSLDEVMAAGPLVSMATTATTPHIHRLEHVHLGTVVLHVSLRDLDPAIILEADNVVDDPDHVCRAKTSLHLAEQQVSNRGFIRASLGEILLGEKPATTTNPLCIFSPFGLGILDVAVGSLAYREARRAEELQVIKDFYAPAWHQPPK